jgi:hypothetical protein
MFGIPVPYRPPDWFETHRDLVRFSMPACFFVEAPGTLAARLFRQHFTRAAESDRKIFEFGQAVFHIQNPLGIVDVRGWLEIQANESRAVDRDCAKRRMIVHEMAAAELAELSFTHRRLRVLFDKFSALNDFDVIRLPDTERVYRARRPSAARLTMAIAHRERLPFGGKLDCAAEATTLVRQRDLLSAVDPRV